MLTKISTMPRFRLVLVALVMPYLLLSCMQYKTTALPPGQMVLFEKERIVFLHAEQTTYRLLNIRIQRDGISCVRIIDPLAEANKKGAQTHLYLADNDSLQLDSLGHSLIPFSSVAHVEIRDVDMGLTVVYSCLGTAAAAGLAFLVILLTKDSCPFIYTYDGEYYAFVGEIYSGSIYPPLERHDYLILTEIKPVNDQYLIRMTNEVKEIQHTNLSELMVMDHSKDLDVIIDRHGNIHTIKQAVTAREATSFSGQDVSTLLSEVDNQIYLANDTLKMQTKDGVIVTFDRPEGSVQSKLVIKAKNSFWLDYAFGQLAREIGTRYPDWRAGQSSKTADDLWQNSLDNGIPLSVSIETENGWEFVDYFTVVGPLAFKDDVMSIDLSKVSGDQVKLKLEYGYLFWELDYVAMDYSADVAIKHSRISLSSAITQINTDVSNLLMNDDDHYYDQPNIGDAVMLRFSAPTLSTDLDRTVVLHSKGHYEVLHNGADTPDLMALKSYRHAGGFLEFSRDRLKSTLGM